MSNGIAAALGPQSLQGPQQVDVEKLKAMIRMNPRLAALGMLGTGTPMIPVESVAEEPAFRPNIPADLLAQQQMEAQRGTQLGTLAERTRGASRSIVGQMPSFPTPPRLPSPEYPTPPRIEPTDLTEITQLLMSGAPKPPDTPGKLEQLAAVLGGAAQGAAGGLQSPFTAAVIAGAGAGAQRSLAELTKETRERQQQFETQNQIHLRTQTGILAQQKLSEQQSRAATAGMQQRADLSKAEMEYNRSVVEINMDYEKSKAEFLARQPQLIRGATGLQSMYVDENGQIVVTETSDSVFMKGLMEIEALAKLAESSGMGQEGVMVGFKEIARKFITPAEWPLYVVSAAILHNPGPAIDPNTGMNILTIAQQRLFETNPDAQMLFAAVNSGRRSEDQYNRWQAMLQQELMIMMTEPGGSGLFTLMDRAYGGMGTQAAQSGMSYEMISNILGGLR